MPVCGYCRLSLSLPFLIVRFLAFTAQGAVPVESDPFLRPALDVIERVRGCPVPNIFPEWTGARNGRDVVRPPDFQTIIRSTPVTSASTSTSIGRIRRSDLNARKQLENDSRSAMARPGGCKKVDGYYWPYEGRQLAGGRAMLDATSRRGFTRSSSGIPIA
jgi:hypothetical protein